MNSFHYNCINYERFPLTILDPDTEEEFEAECSFTFFPDFSGNYYDHPEPASVEIVDIVYKGKSIINNLSNWQYRAIQDELLSCMLEIY